MWGISASSKRTAETTELERSSDAGKKKRLMLPLFLLGGNQSRARKHFFPLRSWKKDGKHKEDLMLYKQKKSVKHKEAFLSPKKVSRTMASMRKLCCWFRQISLFMLHVFLHPHAGPVRHIIGNQLVLLLFLCSKEVRCTSALEIVFLYSVKSFLVLAKSHWYILVPERYIFIPSHCPLLILFFSPSYMSFVN